MTLGEASGEIVAPSEADTTLARTGEWYWKPGQPVKSLTALAALYDGSVGHNSNLLLGVPIDYSGAVAADSAARLVWLCGGVVWWCCCIVVCWNIVC